MTDESSDANAFDVGGLTTADILARYQPKSWLQERIDRQMPSLQDYYRGQQGGMLTKEQLEGAPAHEEPNAIGRAMSYVPPEVMFAANFLGPKVPLPPRISNPIRAYHGSPHNFDKFDLSKIGTGEGAQAYGHGLYFAENEGVAKSYKQALAKTNVLVDGKPVTRGSIGNKWLEDELGSGYFAGPDQLDKVYAAHALSPVVQDAKAKLSELVASGRIKFDTSGKMYEVALHATPESFLDWDKPLAGNHPGTASVLERIYAESAKRSGYKVPLDRSAPTEAHYTSLLNSEMQANPDTFGPTLRDQLASKLATEGIPGIRYLDQGSRGYVPPVRNSPEIDAVVAKMDAMQTAVESRRGATADDLKRLWASPEWKTLETQKARLHEPRLTSNYVVWSPEIIEILRKYGIIGPAVVGASGALAPSERD
jgi:hypothetical protein